MASVAMPYQPAHPCPLDRRGQDSGPGDGGHLCALGAAGRRLVVAGIPAWPLALLLLGVVAVSYQLITGIGTWGLNRIGGLGI